MIPIKKIREEKEFVLDSLSSRGAKPNIDLILKLDEDKRKSIAALDLLRAERNTV